MLQKDAQYLVETLRLHVLRQLCVGLSLFDGLHGLDGLFPLEAADRDKLTHLVVFVRLFFDDSWGHRDISSVVPWDKVLVRTLLSCSYSAHGSRADITTPIALHSRTDCYGP